MRRRRETNRKMCYLWAQTFQLSWLPLASVVGLPALDKDGIACDRLNGLAQGLLDRRRVRRSDIHVVGLNGDDEAVAPLPIT